MGATAAMLKSDCKVAARDREVSCPVLAALANGLQRKAGPPGGLFAVCSK